MASLKVLFEECYDKGRRGGFETTTGIANVSKVNAPSYTRGYCWRYMSRKKGQCITCSSTTLIGLIERCVARNISLCVVDRDKARKSCESEGIDYEELLQNKLVVL